MGTIELTATQRGRAEQLKDRLDSGEVSKPQDINRVRPWGHTSMKEMNEKRPYEVYEPENVEEVNRPIDPDNIIGVCGSPNPNEHNPQVERLEKRRLHRTLDRLMAGEFDVRHSDPPQYVEFNGDLYVGADGTHRSIACKAINIDEIWADVTIL